MTATLSRPIFSDELIKATELNRHSGQILDRAKKHPVTIARNEDFFTLIKREELTSLVDDADQTKEFTALLIAALAKLKRGQLDSSHPYNWLNAFDAEETQELLEEVIDNYQLALHSVNHREELEAIIHEWHESAIAILSDDLADAWDDTEDETALTAPVPVDAYSR